MNVLQCVTAIAALWVVILVSCAGCALPPVQYLPDERRALDAAQAGWETATGSHCHRLDTVDVAYVWAPCGNRNSADCVQMRGARQTIMVREGQPLIDSLGGPVVHGALHVCEGSGGADHGNPLVWIAAGGATSAQGRARSILTPALPR